MKLFSKRAFFAILILLAALCVCAFASAASSGTCGASGDNLTWTLDDNGLLTISGTGEMEDYAIRESMNYYRLAPWDRTAVKTVRFGAGVTSIGDEAFYECTGLTDITIPETITRIGSSAFRKSGLKTATVNCRAKIDLYCFNSCTTLTDLHVSPDHHNYSSKDGVVFDKEGISLLFMPRGRSGVYKVPEGVKNIQTQSCEGCNKLTGVVLPDGLYNISNSAFWGCSGLTSMTIPDTVRFLLGEAFHGCTGLKSVSIPETIREIPEYVFWGCTSLTEVKIPAGVEYIDRSAFDGCTSLASVTIPSSVTMIKEKAFRNCALKDVTLTAKVDEIGDDAFDKNVVIHAPEGSIAARWAYDHYYEVVTFPAEHYVIVRSSNIDYGTVHASVDRGKKGTKVKLTVKARKGYVFTGWQVESGNVEIKNNQFKIGSEDVSIVAWFDVDKTSATVSGGVYKLDADKKTAVYMKPENTSITSVKIPDTIKAYDAKYKVVGIAANAFKGCNQLASCTIGKNVAEIGKQAFSKCAKLKTITIKTKLLTMKSVGKNAFKGIYGKATFKCPKGMKAEYEKILRKKGAPKKSKFQ